MINPIPGQEDRNCEFLLNNGSAMLATETFPLDEAVFQFLRSAQKAENMRGAIELIRKPNSTRDLCEFAIEKISRHCVKTGTQNKVKRRRLPF
jgi:processive 1,2-diacylglycerol beta-glucosyltransferase